MLSHGKNEFEYYFIDPATTPSYQIRFVKLVKKREKGLEKRVPEEVSIPNTEVTLQGTRSVTFDRPRKLVDLSTYRQSEKRQTQIVDVSAGDYVFQVVSVTLPDGVREGPLEIVVLPGTALGLTLIGLETILEKEKRARESPINKSGVSREYIRTKPVGVVAHGAAPSSAGTT